jgi:hypothetical protein
MRATEKGNGEAGAIPPMVSLSGKVAVAYLSTRGDVAIEDVPGLIEGVYRSLKRIAAVEETGAAAACAFLDSEVGRAGMKPILRLVGGRGDQVSRAR